MEKDRFLEYRSRGSKHKMAAFVVTQPKRMLDLLLISLYISHISSENTTHIPQENATQALEENVQRYAEIHFDNFYTLIFEGRRMLRFQQCLCNRTASRCNIRHTRLGTYTFNVNETTIDSRNGSRFNKTDVVSCYPGDFPQVASFRCSRRQESIEKCNQRGTCQFVHFMTKQASGAPENGLRPCDFDCITVAWSGYGVNFRNFTRNVEFKEGPCGATATTTVPSTIASSSTQAQRYAVSDSDDANSIIVAVVGWVLFAVALVVILALVIYKQRSAKKTKEKESISMKSQTNHNSSYGFTNGSRPEESDQPITPNSVTDRSRRDERSRPNVSNSIGDRTRRDEASPTHLPPPRADAQYDTAHRNDTVQDEDAYLDLVQDEDDVYMVIDEESAADGAKADPNTNGVVPKSSLKGTTTSPNRGPSILKKKGVRYADLPVAPVGAADNSEDLKGKGDKHVQPNLRKQPSTKVRDPAADDYTDAVDDYTRLKTGRLENNPEVTDSFLATYNTVTEDPMEEGQMKYPMDTDEDGENRNSGGYTVLERAEDEEEGVGEDSIARDSAGYSMANKATPAKYQGAASRDAGNGYMTAKPVEPEGHVDLLIENLRGGDNLDNQADIDTSRPVNPYDMARRVSTA